MFEYLVVGMVLHKELTGYDIKKEIESGIGNLLKASYGQVYPALKKLTGKGYLTLSERMNGKLQKKYYKATEEGKRAFLEWLSLPFDQKVDGNLYLAKVFFFGELPSDIRIRRLQEYESYIQQLIRQLETIEKELSTEDLGEREYFELSAFYFSYQLLQNTIRWIRYIKEQKPLSEFLRVEEASK